MRVRQKNVIRQTNAIYANRCKSGHHHRVVLERLRVMGHEIMPRYRQCQSIFSVIFAGTIYFVSIQRLGLDFQFHCRGQRIWYALIRIHSQNLKRTAFLILPALVIFVISCSQLTAPEDSAEEYIIRSISVNPVQVVFSPADGIRDTVVSIAVETNFQDTTPLNTRATEALYVVQLRDAVEGTVLREVSTPMGQNTTEKQTVALSWSTSTIQRNDFTITSFVVSSGMLLSNSASARFSIIGFSVGLPEIQYFSNPDVVKIPSAGTNNFRLSAKVVHPFDQDLISRVLVDIRDQNNTLLSGSPFRMYDDGSLQQIDTGGVSGDLVARDSLYSRQFQISAANNPDVYTLYYHAIDNFGASSDTLTSQMIFQR
jgi:hypothetical protein